MGRLEVRAEPGAIDTMKEQNNENVADDHAGAGVPRNDTNTGILDINTGIVYT